MLEVQVEHLQLVLEAFLEEPLAYLEVQVAFREEPLAYLEVQVASLVEPEASLEEP